MIKEIPLREILHFLGWRGTQLEDALVKRIMRLSQAVLEEIVPRVAVRRFAVEGDGSLASAAFVPEGKDVRALLSPCREVVLMAATLGPESERMLLRFQAHDASDALLLDAVLSAAIEAVCDEAERKIRGELQAKGLYLTDRFSPGYGDMPAAQTRGICDVLNTVRAIGLTVSASGIMIPRKSVTAIMGVSESPVPRRAKGCQFCAMRETCALSEMRR